MEQQIDTIKIKIGPIHRIYLQVEVDWYTDLSQSRKFQISTLILTMMCRKLFLNAVQRFHNVIHEQSPKWREKAAEIKRCRSYNCPQV